jgi:hypothetical protein
LGLANKLTTGQEIGWSLVGRNKPHILIISTTANQKSNTGSNLQRDPAEILMGYLLRGLIVAADTPT